MRDDSVHRIQETQAALGFALWSAVQAELERVDATRRWLTHAAATPTDREAAVLDRITAFRRRRPRLRDDVVTLAHGAGGKASAALVDAVFLDAFADGEPGAAARRGDADAAERASASRSAPTPSSCSRCASPAARSVTSPCTAP